MIWEIIKKEYLVNFINYRMPSALLIGLVLGVTSSFILTNEYNEELRSYYVRVAKHRQDLGRATTYKDLLSSGILIDKPPGVLSAFIRGLTKGATESAYISIYNVPTLGIDAGSNPLLYVFKPIDYLFIFWVVFSLMAILFGYDLISGEKESGVLRLIVSGSVPKTKLITGKYIGGLLSLTTVFAITLASGLVVIGLRIATPFSGEDWLRVLAMGVLAFLYLNFFYTLALLVSSLTVRPVVTLFVSLFVWTLILFVLPYTIYVSRVGKFPNVDQVTRRIDEIKQKQSVQISTRIGKSIMEKRKPLNTTLIMDIAQATISEGTQEEVKIREQYETDLFYQINLTIELMRIAPSELLRLGLTRLAKTGFHYQQGFIERARLYRTYFINYLMSGKNKMAKVNPTSLPPFAYQGESFRESMQALSLDYFILLGLDILLLVTSFLCFSRYDVR